MNEGVQMSLNLDVITNFGVDINKKITVSKNIEKNADKKFNFEELFIDNIKLTERHNDTSMAICGDSLEILRNIKDN